MYKTQILNIWFLLLKLPKTTTHPSDVKKANSRQDIFVLSCGGRALSMCLAGTEAMGSCKVVGQLVRQWASWDCGGVSEVVGSLQVVR